MIYILDNYLFCIRDISGKCRSISKEEWMGAQHSFILAIRSVWSTCVCIFSTFLLVSGLTYRSPGERNTVVIVLGDSLTNLTNEKKKLLYVNICLYI